MRFREGAYMFQVIEFFFFLALVPLGCLAFFISVALLARFVELFWKQILIFSAWIFAIVASFWSMFFADFMVFLVFPLWMVVAVAYLFRRRLPRFMRVFYGEVGGT